MAGALKALLRTFIPTLEWDDEDRADYPKDRERLDKLYTALLRWNSCNCADCSRELKEELD